LSDDGQEKRSYELMADTDPTFRESWLRFVRANREAGLFLHPRLNPDRGKTQGLAGWKAGNAAAPELASIAVLAEKAIRIRPVPGFRAAVANDRLRTSLHGSRLTRRARQLYRR
jgi:hypothetical protein